MASRLSNTTHTLEAHLFGREVREQSLLRYLCKHPPPRFHRIRCHRRAILDRNHRHSGRERHPRGLPRLRRPLTTSTRTPPAEHAGQPCTIRRKQWKQRRDQRTVVSHLIPGNVLPLEIVIETIYYQMVEQSPTTSGQPSYDPQYMHAGNAHTTIAVMRMFPAKPRKPHIGSAVSIVARRPPIRQHWVFSFQAETRDPARARLS